MKFNWICKRELCEATVFFPFLFVLRVSSQNADQSAVKNLNWPNQFLPDVTSWMFYHCPVSDRVKLNLARGKKNSSRWNPAKFIDQLSQCWLFVHDKRVSLLLCTHAHIYKYIFLFPMNFTWRAACKLNAPLLSLKRHCSNVFGRRILKCKVQMPHGLQFVSFLSECALDNCENLQFFFVDYYYRFVTAIPSSMVHLWFSGIQC